MFGVVQGGAGGAGIAAPFGNPSSQPSLSMAPRTKSSGRYNKHKHHSTLAPFRDDTRLVALRYDQTVALEPPIPLPPPRSPLRPPPRASSFNLASGSTPNSPVTVAPPPRPPPPTEQHPALRTISSPRTLDSDTRRDSVLASTISSHSYGSYGLYTSAYYEADSSDEEEDDDPFAYERIDAVSKLQPLQLKAGSAGSSIYSLPEREGSLDHQEQKRGHSLQLQRERRSQRDTEGEGEGRRASEADSSRPSEASLSPTLSIGGSSTASPAFPASPATPPPHFSKRFVRSFSLRSGSLYNTTSKSSSLSSASSASTSMKRLRKKSQAGEDGKEDGGSAIASVKAKAKAKGKAKGNGNDSVNRSVNGNGNGNRRVERSMDMGTSKGTSLDMELPDTTAPSHHSSLLPASTSTSSPLPLSQSHSHSWSATNPIHPTNTTNTTPPNPNHTHTSTRSDGSANVGPASPVISTNIPCGSFFEEDDLSKLSFSIRGSLIFGGKRPWKTSGSTSSANLKMADKDVIPEQSTLSHATSTSSNNKARVFPLVPTASKKDHGNPTPAPAPAPARPPREDDMGVAAMIQKPFQLPESPRLPQRSQSELVNDTASTSHKLPPSIRVISAEAEKESQKVRSLYESGEGLQLGDGDVPWPLGRVLEPPLEAPSDADGNDAYDFLDSPSFFCY